MRSSPPFLHRLLRGSGAAGHKPDGEATIGWPCLWIEIAAEDQSAVGTVRVYAYFDPRFTASTRLSTSATSLSAVARVGSHQGNFKKAWELTLRRAKVPHFRLYDLRSTFATRLSAGGVADERVTQLLRQTDAQVFKKYSQMKLGMKREALTKLNREANESDAKQSFDTDDEE